MSIAISETKCPAGWEKANEELDRRFLKAMSTKDLEGVMSCCADSPDLVMVIWGKEMRGPQQLRETITEVFHSYDELKLEIDRVSEFPSGEAVIAVGQATYTLKKAGQVSTIKEVWTDVRRQIDGRWVYVLDHAEILH